MDENDALVSSHKKDYYAVLNLPRDCTTEDVKRKYKLLAQKVHPDKVLSNDEAAKKSFSLIHEAYQILQDDEKRKVYDIYGHTGVDDSTQSKEIMMHRNGKRRRNVAPSLLYFERQKAREQRKVNINNRAGTSLNSRSHTR